VCVFFSSEGEKVCEKGRGKVKGKMEDERNLR
jgi:hypothetical protein